MDEKYFLNSTLDQSLIHLYKLCNKYVNSLKMCILLYNKITWLILNERKRILINIKKKVIRSCRDRSTIILQYRLENHEIFKSQDSRI